jgi:hypothetical protein
MKVSFSANIETCGLNSLRIPQKNLDLKRKEKWKCAPFIKKCFIKIEVMILCNDANGKKEIEFEKWKRILQCKEKC